MRLITISRQLGSRGDDVARELAGRLGWRLLGREIIQEAARRAGVLEGEVARVLERRRPRLVARVLDHLRDLAGPGMLPVFTPGVGVATLDWAYFPADQPQSDVRVTQRSLRGYVKLLAEVILEMSRQEEVVILGAGGQVILQDHPQALHVRIVAPQERRLERMQELGLGQRAEAIQALRQSDAARSGYLHVYFDRDINDALLYHLVLNAGRLSLEDIVDLLVRRVQRLEDADHA